jgi:hypothetical protein
LTIDPSGQFLYLQNFGDATISGYTIQPFGVLQPIAGSPFSFGTTDLFITTGEIH